MYQTIIRFFPKKIKNHLFTLLSYARIKTNKEQFIGFLVISSIGTALALSFYISKIFQISFIITFLISTFVLQVSFYFILSLKADSTAKFVESILPDALQLMSSNLRAGLTTDRALLLSARPEFGVLSEEINLIGKKITLGEDIANALIEMTSRFRSEKLKKTFLLIVSGLRAGGELTDLLDQTAETLRQKQFLDEKIRTNVLMYVIFIFTAIGIGAPILFGLSTFLVKVLETNLSNIEIPETTAIPITFSKTTISSSFTTMFAIVSLLTTSILGSLVLGLINKGQEKAGLKFVPLLVILTISIFFITRLIISSILGGLFALD